MVAGIPITTVAMGDPMTNPNTATTPRPSPLGDIGIERGYDDVAGNAARVEAGPAQPEEREYLGR